MAEGEDDMLANAVSRAPGKVERSGHIALVGFMGAGKSTVGKALAERLELPFVDIDEHIARKAERPIFEIFKGEGEVGFRARERAAVRELLAIESPSVMATGGGTFADPKLRQLLRSLARTVYLEADIEVVQQRLLEGDGTKSRPMLAGPNPEVTLRRLLKERVPAYREAELTVSVDELTVDLVVERVISGLGVEGSKRRHRPVRVNGPAERRSAPTGSRVELAASREHSADDRPMNVTTSTHDYRIHFEADAGNWIGDAISQQVQGRRVALITDDNVAGLHVEPIRKALEARNKTVQVHVVPAGETSKSIAQVSRLYDALLQQELDRRDAVVAVGGGVVGDLAGFVASTFLRGVDFVQVPTTTLACVDSSVGGKTGINTPRGKNLVGTFYPPKLVCVAGAHLRTLGRKEHAAGIAESVKMAACLDAELFSRLGREMSRLLELDMDALLPVLRRSAGLKAYVVSEDEKERGLRAVLNYGHTIGHAIERGHNYSILHGEAVALGMIAEAEWADAEGLSNGIAKSLEAIFTAAGLPTAWRNHRVDISALRLDKKRAGGSVTLPVVTTLGQFDFKTVPISAISEFVSLRSNG